MIETNYLLEQLSAMAEHVTEALERSLRSFHEYNTAEAQKVIDSDTDLDSMEVELDAAVLEAIEDHTSDDEDLKGLLAIKTVGQALERIGDHAVNIAEAALSIAKEEEISFPNNHLHKMADQTREMLSDAIASFLDKDAVKASSVIQRDEEIDNLNAAMVEQARDLVVHGKASFEMVMEILRVSRNLERIADISTNIAEEAIFWTTGVIVKHSNSKHTSESQSRLAF